MIDTILSVAKRYQEGGQTSKLLATCLHAAIEGMIQATHLIWLRRCKYPEEGPCTLFHQDCHGGKHY